MVVGSSHVPEKTLYLFMVGRCHRQSPAELADECEGAERSQVTAATTMARATMARASLATESTSIWSRTATAWCAGLCAYLAESTSAIRAAPANQTTF
jgi:hypothetical protein